MSPSALSSCFSIGNQRCIMFRWICHLASVFLLLNLLMICFSMLLFASLHYIQVYFSLSQKLKKIEDKFDKFWKVFCRCDHLVFTIFSFRVVAAVLFFILSLLLMTWLLSRCTYLNNSGLKIEIFWEIIYVCCICFCCCFLLLFWMVYLLDQIKSWLLYLMLLLFSMFFVVVVFVQVLVK